MQLRKLSGQRFVEAPHSVIPNLFRDPVLILSEDGGALTDNAVFISHQRVFALKRSAVLMFAIWNGLLATALLRTDPCS